MSLLLSPVLPISSLFWLSQLILYKTVFILQLPIFKLEISDSRSSASQVEGKVCQFQSPLLLFKQVGLTKFSQLVTFNFCDT